MTSLKPGRKLWIHAGMVVLLLCLGFGLVQFCRYGWEVITFSYPVDYGEGPLLDQVQRLSHGENIYRAGLDTFPFTISNYPPLYVLVQVPFAAWFGPAFWYGRALSWVSTVVAGVCLALTIRALTRDWLAAVAGGLLLLAAPHVLAWSPLFRVDALALALSWGALFVIARWPGRRWSLFVTAGMVLAAVFTRQSYGLAAPFAAFVWLLRHHPRHRAFELATWTGGVGLALFLLLNALTRGGFYFNIVTANVNRFEMRTLLNRALELVAMLPLPMVLALVFLALGRRAALPGWWLAAPYLVGAVISGATIGKIGSNVNYLLELCAALSFITAWMLAWVRNVFLQGTEVKSSVARTVLTVVLPLLLAVQAYAMITSDAGYAPTIRRQVANAFEQELLLDMAALTDGPILTGQHMGLLALAERPIYHQPFEMRQLAASGVWDQTPFLAALEQHYFAKILMFRPPGFPLEERRWTPEMLSAIDTHYRPIHNIGATVVYVPRGE
ncbi:MAG: hypothetical protein JXB35_12365 [Anaerolineae bacterium]|nr:hypothetical protein [Anaerolineae bacterium]